LLFFCGVAIGVGVSKGNQSGVNTGNKGVAGVIVGSFVGVDVAVGIGCVAVGSDVDVELNKLSFPHPTNRKKVIAIMVISIFRIQFPPVENGLCAIRL